MKLQVICPRRVTGGPEALHQLVDAARSAGADARVVYAPLGQPDAALPTPAYRLYDTPVDTGLDDSPDTMVVAPETLTRMLSGLRRARRAIWWLSIDNYLSDRRRVAPLWAERLGLRRRRFDLDRPAPGTVHFAQSAYARAFLESRGLGPVQMLSDYLRPDFFRDVERDGAAGDGARGPVVAYNPAKGMETTRRLIDAAPSGLTFVRLEKLSPLEVRQALERSAVYIDFGQHPGRDRLPREAAICGCNIVTGRCGAAANDIDIPIPGRYKIDEAGADFVSQATAAIAEAALGYRGARHRFDAYRESIRAQQRDFMEEVRQVLASHA